MGRRFAGILEVDQLSVIQAQIASLTNQLAIQKRTTMAQVAAMQGEARATTTTRRAVWSRGCSVCREQEL